MPKAEFMNRLKELLEGLPAEEGSCAAYYADCFEDADDVIGLEEAFIKWDHES